MKPFAAASAWSVLSPQPVARLVLPVWAQNASGYFQVRLALVQTVTDPSGALPDACRVDLDVQCTGFDTPTRVAVVTVPWAQAPEVQTAAHAGVNALGGAGMDALVARTTRVWQCGRVCVGPDALAPLRLAAVIASVFLGPIVPPDEVTVFGLRGARIRLEALARR